MMQLAVKIEARENFLVLPWIDLGFQKMKLKEG